MSRVVQLYTREELNDKRRMSWNDLRILVKGRIKIRSREQVLNELMAEFPGGVPIRREPEGRLLIDDSARRPSTSSVDVEAKSGPSGPTDDTVAAHTSEKESELGNGLDPHETDARHTTRGPKTPDEDVTFNTGTASRTSPTVRSRTRTPSPPVLTQALTTGPSRTRTPSPSVLTQATAGPDFDHTQSHESLKSDGLQRCGSGSTTDGWPANWPPAEQDYHVPLSEEAIMRLEAEDDCVEDLSTLAETLSQQFVKTRGLDPLTALQKSAVVDLLKPFWLNHWELNMFRLGKLKAPEWALDPEEGISSQATQENLDSLLAAFLNSQDSNDAALKPVQEEGQDGQVSSDTAVTPRDPSQAASEASGRKRRFDEIDVVEGNTDATACSRDAKRRRSQ
ncbi:hypothetical protein PHLGIDRAFT_298449 [Phlebiopsis gigantea 11061_1 CR5-6]|uniref:Uncharacterized protein n=1 Tax=Phlebiopsis gigantea (strain 11061_1 CR5-6) TaxID=745531 RepID=A0A0C3S0B5_PHLG1|nr:hypothetical protein PHLGIDRAFT_298449 [Phlebiopsis gigantea 11061_1 CR5-6]